MKVWLEAIGFWCLIVWLFYLPGFVARTRDKYRINQAIKHSKNVIRLSKGRPKLIKGDFGKDASKNYKDDLFED